MGWLCPSPQFFKLMPTVRRATEAEHDPYPDSDTTADLVVAGARRTLVSMAPAPSSPITPSLAATLLLLPGDRAAYRRSWPSRERGGYSKRPSKPRWSAGPGLDAEAQRAIRRLPSLTSNHQHGASAAPGR
jgi:hypothetical protein